MASLMLRALPGLSGALGGLGGAVGRAGGMFSGLFHSVGGVFKGVFKGLGSVGGALSGAAAFTGKAFDFMSSPLFMMAVVIGGGLIAYTVMTR